MDRISLLSPDATRAGPGFRPLPYYGHPAFAEHFGFSGPEGLSASSESAPEGAATGLVGSIETKGRENRPSSIFPEVFSSSEFARLGRARRLRRVCRAVMAKSRSVRASVPAGFRWTGAFITLTYRPGVSWAPDHIGYFRRLVADYCRRRGVRFRFVWVAETQKNGAVHYHVVVWWSSAAGRDFRLPKPDERGWWPHGLSNIRRLRSAGESYLAKYLSKGDVGAFPKGLRLYGMDRDPSDSLAVHRACLPDWLRRVCPTGRVDRVKHFGFVSRDTGARFASWWRLERVASGCSSVWRFVPAVRRDPACLDCIFAVLKGRVSVPHDYFGEPFGEFRVPAF